MPAAEMPDMLPDMYASLGVSRSATNTEIRRAYRNLITKVRPNHPPTTRPPVPSPIKSYNSKTLAPSPNLHRPTD
jgi:preprotein translocase subunit Sec63